MADKWLSDNESYEKLYKELKKMVFEEYTEDTEYWEGYGHWDLMHLAKESILCKKALEHYIDNDDSKGFSEWIDREYFYDNPYVTEYPHYKVTLGYHWQDKK